MIARPFLTLLLLALAIPLAGCGSYAVQGRVVAGEFTTLAFVAPDDPRLAAPGVPSVEVRLHRDPMRPNRELASRGLSGPDGSIHLPVSAFGAGWLIEQWQITARRSGYETADAIVTLPKSPADGRLLVILAPGMSLPIAEPEDLMEQYRRFR